MTLTFTAGAKRSTPKAPRNPRLDHIGFCQDTLAEIETQRAALARTEATIKTLSERVLNGQRWLATHPDDHPRRERNRKLLARLEWEMETAQWARRHSTGALLDLSVALWGAWDAMSPIERQAVDVSSVERPDSERYARMMTNWHVKEV